MKKYFYLLGLALMSAFTFTACLEGSEKDNTYYMEDYYTVTGSMVTGYTLYSDNGLYVTLDRNAFTSETGFGSAERVLMTSVYSEKMITEDKKGLINPDIASCIILPTTNPMPIDLAMNDKVLEADSCSAVSKLECWAYRGYLTASPTAYYGSVRPTLNLVYDPTTLRNDSVDFQLCYNLHNSKVTSSGIYYTSFRLEPLSYLVPGANDVIVTIKCKGCNDIKIKVPRKDFRRGNY